MHTRRFLLSMSTFFAGGCGDALPFHALEVSGAGGASTTAGSTASGSGGALGSGGAPASSGSRSSDVSSSSSSGAPDAGGAFGCGNITINGGPAVACTCSYSQAGNDAECGPSVLEAPLCCASVTPAWPQVGGTCVCQDFACTGSAGNCSCAVATVFGSSNGSTCTGKLCCAGYLSDGFSSCTCDDALAACDQLDGGPGEPWVRVPSCTRADVGCSPGVYAETAKCR